VRTWPLSALPPLCASLGLLVGCRGPYERAPGERTPLSAACERLDGTRCLLPWPSSTYTTIDATTATGLRLSVQAHSLPTYDDPTTFNLSDGFSVATPLAVGFPAPIDPTLDGQLSATGFLLFVATPGPNYGQPLPLRLSVVDDSTSSDAMLVGYPMLPLRYNTDYVAVVLDQVKGADGGTLQPTSSVEIALGLAPAQTPADQDLASYHAPTRSLLQDVDVDRAHVLRVFDFTTRSEDGVGDWLEQMRGRELQALDAGEVSVAIDSADVTYDGAALEVLGDLAGVPGFITDAGALAFDGGTLLEQGPHLVPFRALVPAGSGSYPMVIYGHSLGGNYTDTDFDTQIIAVDAGKLGVEFYGWTQDTAPETLIGFERPLTGAVASTAGLVQALADTSVLEAALDAALGESLASATVSGVSNPGAGRWSDPGRLVYAGGSLGGTLGLVHASSEPSLKGAVLNVPGAAWTHFIPPSEIWSFLNMAFESTTPSQIDRSLGLLMTQTLWDPVDGAAWASLSTAHPCVSLLQESMGDPILPNIGGSFAAESMQATQVGVVLDPILGLPQASVAHGHTGITQYRVPSSVTDPYQIHGFAVGDTPAGEAAREQITAFLQSVWAGAPEIQVPPTCLAQDGGTCDFSTF
jgi:hypothetical protein